MPIKRRKLANTLRDIAAASEDSNISEQLYALADELAPLRSTKERLTQLEEIVKGRFDERK